MSIDPRKPCPATMTPEGCSSRNALFCKHGYLGDGTAETGLAPQEETERALMPDLDVHLGIDAADIPREMAENPDA